jgi:EmrB/QacA subfamily drug resistance transporter
MAFIDGTVVNVALPALQEKLDATVTDVQWVVEAYALLLAALILVGGSLGDRYGRRLVFSLGVGLFALSSVACGLASSITQLILARALQGVAGALLVPGSLAIISASFGEERRGKAIGTWSGFTAITTALGPVVGGWLVDHVSWRAAFFLNVPIAAAVLLVAFRHVPESRDEEAKGHLDFSGAALTTLGLGGVVYGLIESARVGFTHPAAVISLFGGSLLMIIFVVVESRSSSPMLPLNLFRSRNFSGANLLTLFLYTALAGVLFFFPLNLIQVQGYSATAAGAASLPFILIMSVLSRWSGGLAGRYGAKLPLIIGPIIAAIGFALFAVPGVSAGYWVGFFPAVVVLGLGMAVSVAPLTTVIMGAVPESHAGVASGVNNAVARTAGLLAVAVFGIVMLQIFNTSLDQRLNATDIPQGALAQLSSQRTKLAGAETSSDLTPQNQAVLRRVIAESFVGGFRAVCFIAAALSLLSSLSAALFMEPLSRSADKERAEGRPKIEVLT